LDSLTDGLGKIFLSLEGLDPKNDRNYVIVFMLSCFIVGVGILILDLCYLGVSGKSFLKLNHGAWRTPLLFVAWPLGSAIFGFIALVAHIVQPAILGCIGIGVTWNLSVQTLVERFGGSSEDEEPVGEDEE
jgi:hypothetical protein